MIDKHSVEKTIDGYTIESVDKQKLDEWIKNQRNDFSILEGEIRNRYDIEKYIDMLPENIRNIITKAEGELKVFERNSLFEFLEDMSKIDLYK